MLQDSGKHAMRTGVEKNASKYTAGLALMILIYTLGMSYLSILRFESFHASTYDLGIMLQTIWNTANGHLLQESINMGYPMMRFWMAHWEFIYLIFAFFYWCCSSPYTPLVLQSLIVAVGVLPIYWQARDTYQNAKIGLLFGLSYLMYPALQNANLFDIHGLTLAAPFLAFCFYFLHRGQYRMFALSSIFAISCREDSALLLFMMGLYAGLVLKQKKVAWITMVANGLLFLLWFKRLQFRALLGLPPVPIMPGAATHWTHLNQTFTDILYPIKFLAKKHNLEYFIALFGPVAFLCLFDLKTLLLASPVFLINLFSSYFYTHEVEHYYSATITPFVCFAAIFGGRRVLTFLQLHGAQNKFYQRLSKNRVRILASLVLGCSVVLFLLKANAFDVTDWKITPHHRVIKKVIAQIPVEASLSALDVLAPHASERHEIYLFDDNVDKVDYVLYDFQAKTFVTLTRASFDLPFHWPINEPVQALLKNKKYGIVLHEDGVTLWKKGADYAAGLNYLAYAQASEIEVFNTLQLAPDMKFIGHRWHESIRRGFDMEQPATRHFRTMLHFTAFWSAQKDYPIDYQFIYKISRSNIEYTTQHIPVLGLLPSNEWTQGELVRDEVFWLAPREMPSGKYTVSAALKNLDETPPATSEFVPLFETYYEK
ncbi:DUF2079 domain-containing protein [candidate division KSB1 bacterium]|nr:DUF2079 domain-containing protein [candidate division KSB1 bacterium]